MDNVFMFSAYDVLNATRYEWDFGDGTTGQGSSVTHTYDNIDEYTVRCTVYNGDLSASAEITVFAEDIPTDDDFLEQANINSLYHQTFYIDIGTPLVTITGVGSDGSTLTQSQLEWLSYEIREINDRYVFDISGTCTDVTLVGSVITVTVTGGSQEWTWEITVYQEVDSGDVPSRGYAEYVLSGNIVTLTNLDPSDNGIRLVVDWGDGTQTKNGSGATFTHEYTSTGQKIIHLTWYISEMGSETQLTATLTVNIAGSPGTVVYVGGDGAEGSMDIQSGSSSYVIQECGFTKDGATFLGWNSSPDFKGTTSMPGETVSPNGTLTLYAMWSVDNSSSWLEDHILVIVATVLIAAMLLVIVVRRFL